MPLDVLIEGVLFYKTAPVKKADLTALFTVSPEALNAALAILRERLEGGATRLVETTDDVQLVTAPELSETIGALRKEEQARDIGKAGAETLAIVLYRGPVSRSDIDRIRGVNSGYILRTLATRGLIERSTSQKRVEYQVTPRLLRHLGITDKRALPGYEVVMQHLDRYESMIAAEGTTP
jgi:segregation and condensation protein B